MKDLEAYALGYACRLVEDALDGHIKNIDPALCAVQPMKHLLQLQEVFLRLRLPNRSVIRFLYAMHRKFHFNTGYKENAMLDEQLQWIWLMGYYMLDVDGFKQTLTALL